MRGLPRVRDAQELVAATLGLGVELPVDAPKAADYATRAAEQGSVKPLRISIQRDEKETRKRSFFQ